MATPTKDYYAILGVSREANEDEIKRAFRRRARETHPDVAGHEGAEESFKDLNEAYEVLSDPEKRRMYDTYGTADPRATGFGGAGGFDMGDLFTGFDEVFSSFFGGGFAGAGGVRLEGRDMGAQLTVTLEEAAAGAEKYLDLVRDAPCETCSGTGAAEGGRAVSCADCRGTGRRRVGRRTFLGVVESVTPCARCSATGTIVDQPCATCHGSGRARRSERVAVQVPAGVDDGMTLRVQGMGEAGVRGAAAGDLLVTVRIAEHEYLRRQGDDLHAHVGVTYSQAALGDEIEVHGLDGAEHVKVPAGTQYGDVARLKGRGMPRLRGGGRGDLVVHFAVVVPKKLTKKQRELLHELGRTFGDPHTTSPLHKVKDWLNL